MIHQHFFNVRLDLDVDGVRNAVYEVETEALPAGAGNPFGNAFRPVRRLLRTEGESPQVVDQLRGRYWLVVNNERRNAVGEAVGWKLCPGENVLPFAQPDSALPRRAGFVTRHVWVTRFAEGERYAAGDYPYQHRGAPACRPTSRRIGRSRTRMSCSGTRSASTICRDRRTGP